MKIGARQRVPTNIDLLLPQNDFDVSAFESSVSLLLELYVSGYILPLIDYGCTIWGNTSNYNLSRIDKPHKRAGRIIRKLPVRTPSNVLFSCLQ